MKQWRWTFSAVLLLAGSGCGGVSEERVAALEAQVAALGQQPAPQGGTATDGAAEQKLELRVAALEESHEKLEDLLDTLTRELAGTNRGAEPAGASSSSIWQVVGIALGGAASETVALEGDTYQVRRGWLVEELRLAASTKQLPKVAADKKRQGLVVRGVKPKSLFDRLGLKNNDVVVEVGGKPTATPEALVAALQAAESPLQVKLLRKGEELEQQYAIAD